MPATWCAHASIGILKSRSQDVSALSTPSGCIERSQSRRDAQIAKRVIALTFRLESYASAHQLFTRSSLAWVWTVHSADAAASPLISPPPSVMSEARFFRGVSTGGSYTQSGLPWGARLNAVASSPRVPRLRRRVCPRVNTGMRVGFCARAGARMGDACTDAAPLHAQGARLRAEPPWRGAPRCGAVRFARARHVRASTARADC